MSSKSTTITVRDRNFTIRESFKDTLAVMLDSAKSDPWKSIQHLLVTLFSEQPEVRTDEVALLVCIGYPKSKMVDEDKRARRVSVDVSKYNKGLLSGQEEEPEVKAVHLDAPKGGASGVAHDAVSVLEELLS